MPNIQRLTFNLEPGLNYKAIRVRAWLHSGYINIRSRSTARQFGGRSEERFYFFWIAFTNLTMTDK